MLTPELRAELAQELQDNLELPMLPDTAAQVLSLCNEEHCDAKQLSDLICRDQSLAGNVLKVANSATFAPRNPIDSLQQAVSRLGITTISEIAMAVALKGRVFKVPGYQARVREMWMHSAAAGVFAKEIAKNLGFDTERSFLCGLLHDGGRPIVLQTLVKVRDESTPMGTDLFDAAMEEFHAEIGAQLVSEWGSTAWMVDAVRHHHDPRNAGEHIELVQVTCLADVMSHWALDEDASTDDFPADHPVVDDLGLSTDELGELLALRARVLDVAEAFM